MTQTTSRIRPTMTIGAALSRIMGDKVPIYFTAFDGSSAGSPESPIHLDLLNERGLSYLVTAPGDLGLARAYVAGDLDVHGVHPGDPYSALAQMQRELRGIKVTPADALTIVRLSLIHI